MAHDDSRTGLVQRRLERIVVVLGANVDPLRQEAQLNVVRTAAVLTDAFEQLLRPYGITATQFNLSIDDQALQVDKVKRSANGVIMDPVALRAEDTVGRAKDLIIVNGRNIWPQDIEWAVDADLPDGDNVILRGWCEKPGAARIGFGRCEGLVLPAVGT